MADVSAPLPTLRMLQQRIIGKRETRGMPHRVPHTRARGGGGAVHEVHMKPYTDVFVWAGCKRQAWSPATRLRCGAVAGVRSGIGLERLHAFCLALLYVWSPRCAL